MWHRSSPPANFCYPPPLTAQQPQSYKPLGFRSLEADEDDEEEEEEEGVDDDEQDPDEEEEGEPIEMQAYAEMEMNDGNNDDLIDDSEEFN